MYPRGTFGASRWRSQANPFALGVAYGDPLPDGVVLWTRVVAPTGSSSVPIEWEIAHDDRFARIAARGSTIATAELGHSVHVEAQGLDADRVYFYRFRTGSEASVTG